MAIDWLRYTNQGATRNQELSPQLIDALGFLNDLGVTMEVFSGGQPAKGSGGNRVGSTRHDHGNAADVFFHKDGRRLDWANEQDRPIFGQIVSRARANGVTGFGAGDGYMEPGSMHIGFGNPAVWGAGGIGANAPDWLRSAYNSAPALPPPRTVQDRPVADFAASPEVPGSLMPTQPPAGAERPNIFAGMSPEDADNTRRLLTGADRKKSRMESMGDALKEVELMPAARISGGGGDARSTGAALMQLLANPSIAPSLMARRMGGR